MNVTTQPTKTPRKHQHPLGTIVDIDLDLSKPGADEGIEINLKGTCRLYIVGHSHDSDGTPLYLVSDLPVRYPINAPVLHPSRMAYRFFANVVEHGYGEGSLRATGEQRPLYDNVNVWMQAQGV